MKKGIEASIAVISSYKSINLCPIKLKINQTQE